MSGQNIPKSYFIGILFVLSILLYSRTFYYEFLWDDQRSHLTNHTDLMDGKLTSIWAKPYDGMYIPMTYSAWYFIKTKAYDSSTHKLNPKYFHLANILFHSINVVLLFSILLILFKNKWASFIGIALFALHPLQVESVAWISEFRGLFSCFFGLLSIFILINHLSKNKITNALQFVKSKAFLGSTMLYLCALLSKPSAISFPFIVALIIWCFFSDSFKYIYKVFVLWLLLFIPIIYLTVHYQPNEILTYVTPISQRLFIFCYSAWFYITKFTMPVKLAACYGLRPQEIIQDSWLYIYSAIIILLSVYLFLKRNVYKHFFTCYWIFIFSILPVSGLIAFNYQRYSNVADRYMYLPLIGGAILFSYLWSTKEKNNYFKIIVSSYLITCLFLNIKQLPSWKNEFSMWNQAMENYPNQFMAAYNRGVQYGKMNDWDHAIEDYSTAIQFNNKDKNSFVNRANAFSMKNRYKEALNDYSTALELDDTDGSIYYNRAITNYYLKNIRSCVDDITKAQSLRFPVDPKFIEAVKVEIRKRQKFSY